MSAVASRVEIVPATGSTNADLVAAAAADPGALPHLAVLLTHDQTGGRGRLDRTWVAGPGRALAVSVLVRVSAIPVAARGWIPLAAGAAMTHAVAAQLPQHSVRMKWPNDVLVDGNKICGILAEVVPGDADAVVIGSGVNTTMPADELPVPTATSFAVLGAVADEDALIADYVDGLDRALAALAGGASDAVRSSVQTVCATIGREVRVSLPDGSTVSGRAERLDDDGRLVVASDVGERALSAGDVVHVR
ncbi:biotin--acetyl-CoA-carboxylase ligase [Microbacterium mangrovi]|uniref:biotin--[biotin carboxyl-carrier protein] ligase n=1 Tax=Microbacterium mangrovi TaxID=1348253 RepID=A0A0B2A935_9MICO|nr:biotin--acetyl-CoA-carboxylase ligase [Microbacterium mangrovi]